MSKNHIKIAKMFRRNRATDEYFYHLTAKWAVNDKTMIIDEWVSVSKDVYDFLCRDAWKKDKQSDRVSHCRKVDGTRCMEDCEHCPEGKDSRDGSPLSLEQQIELGYMPGDPFDVEKFIEMKDLFDKMYEEIEQLGEVDQRIMRLHFQNYREREIANDIGTCQKTINNRKHAALDVLRTNLEEYR